MAAQIFNRLGQLGVGLALAGGVANSALYNVDGGHRAVMFDRFRGVLPDVTGEGTHFMIPWVQRPITFDIRSRPKNVPSVTGSKDLQNVNITLRILFRPMPDQLPNIYTTLGTDYEDRVLPSITNEVLKAVVAQFDAGELITQREMVSARYVTVWNFNNFSVMPTRFYVKSILARFEMSKSAIFHYLEAQWKFHDFSITQNLREINFGTF